MIRPPGKWSLRPAASIRRGERRANGGEPLPRSIRRPVAQPCHQRFVFYEHLKPGSVRVRVGQHVRRGEVLAALGFPGDSTGPHLHPHVADANAPLDAEGVPYVFTEFEELGVYASVAQFGSVPWSPHAPRAGPLRGPGPTRSCSLQLTAPATALGSTRSGYFRMRLARMDVWVLRT